MKRCGFPWARSEPQERRAVNRVMFAIAVVTPVDAQALWVVPVPYKVAGSKMKFCVFCCDAGESSTFFH